MDMYTLMFDDTVSGHHMLIEEIVLQSNSFAVASIPYVFVLQLIIYFQILKIHDDYDNLYSNVDSVVKLLLNVIVHHELS